MIFALARHNDLVLDEAGVYRLAGAGRFDYSEGEEAERYLAETLCAAHDLGSDSEELQRRIRDWSSEYHLSPSRANLLRGLDFNSVETVLELGCGCGALTRFLGDQGLDVEAVEGSPSRAALARMRCRGLDTVKIACANFHDLVLPEAHYDLVLLIGMLEYAGLYGDRKLGDIEALGGILGKCRAALRPGGAILVAIENRMGLKYWLGAGEDHLAVAGVGLLDYPGQTGIRTYDRRQWRMIVEGLGCKAARLCYPFPDYKMPRVILDEAFVDSDAHAVSLLYRVSSFDPLTGWRPGDDEFLYWKALASSGYLGDFANSFVLALGESDEALGALLSFDFVHFSADSRRPGLRTMTRKPRGQAWVVKERTSPDQIEGKAGLRQRTGEDAYVDGPLLSTLWIEACCRREGEERFVELLGEYQVFLERRVGEADQPGALVDLLPSNIVVNDRDGLYHPIDQEWHSREGDEAGADFILFRALFWFAFHNRDLLERFFAPAPLPRIADFVAWGFARLARPAPESVAFLALEQRLHAEVVAAHVGEIDFGAIFNMPISRNIAEKATPGEPQAQDDGMDDTTPAYVAPSPPSSLSRFRQRVRSWYYAWRNVHYRIIKRSGLLDVEYYLHARPYRIPGGFDPETNDPVMDYVLHGWNHNVNPNAFFDIETYRADNPDCGDGDPLLHYVARGWRLEKNRPQLFFTDYYVKENPESTRRGMTPLGHYLQIGWRQGRRPNPLFDGDFYLRTNPDVGAAGMNPLAHYHFFGRLEDRSPFPFFDAAYYAEDNPSSGRSTFFPSLHYLKFGVGEGRGPNRFFDPEWYRKEYLDECATKLEAFLHYAEQGSAQHLRPWRLFDSRFYAKTYPDYRETALHPLLHYQQTGVRQGRYPCAEVADLAEKPLISVLTPVFNTEEKLLRRSIHSVLYQAYPHWQLCLVDDGSTNEAVRAILAEYAAKDDRVKVKLLECNQGIAAASNEAAAMADGDYLAFLDHDDELTLDALYEMVRVISEERAEVIYSDEDLVNLESRVQDVFLKPAYNRELLLGHNYITHFLVCRRRLFEEWGGFSSAHDGAQDYALVLQLTARTAAVAHIDRVLYHWRASASSTSVNHDQKEYADAAGARALAMALAAREIDAEVEHTELRFYYRARRRLRGAPSVALIVWFLSGPEAIAPWYRRMEARLGYEELRIVCVCAGQGLNLVQDPRIILVNLEKVSPAAALCRGAAATDSEQLLFMSPGLTPEQPDWIKSLLEYSQDEGLGAVGGRIDRHAADPVQVNADPRIDTLDPAYYQRFFIESSRHQNGMHCAQNVLAISAELCMVKRRLFQAAGGFDAERYPSAFFDADFCLRLRAAGHESVYTPYCRLQADDVPVPQENTQWEREMALFQQQWAETLRSGDPYYNVHRVLRRGIERWNWQRWYAGVGAPEQA